ncbi:uncharacterized protein LOC129919611 [Episyrphus balteatus]|uniref:uncharacterized protein LOC129919611 n=1 Tax=Episyrphus balteatus TaxID=286459 RepID=UPI002484E865|nr:uncharacterized protein LOC129919611 [Episyrphus balteatus]
MGTGSNTYQPPEWLTSDFLQDVLKEYFKDDTIQVQNMIVRSACEPGKVQGFASEIHRASFDLVRNSEPGKFSVIIKDHPKGYTGMIAQKSKLFHREILSYKEILPRIEELLATIGDNTKMSPACYYTTESPEPFLILEDMEVSGFKSFEKQRLLNLDYVLPTMEKIAKIHACSAVLAAKDPKMMKFFNEPPISRNPERKEFLGFFPVNIRCVAEEVAQWKGFEEITEKLFKLSENVLQESLKMYDTHAKGFQVFNICDLWINNLMFNLDDNFEPQDVILLDYQLAYFGSPATDINYFLFGSMNENVRKVHFKFIVREYHRHLKETLEKLNYGGQIPTLKDIHVEIIRNSLIGVIASTCLTPLILMESESCGNLENLTSRTDDGDKMRRENVQNIKYRAYLQKTLKEFELSGFLDV